MANLTLLTLILFGLFVYFIFKHHAQLIVCLLGLGNDLLPDTLYIMLGMLCIYILVNQC